MPVNDHYIYEHFLYLRLNPHFQIYLFVQSRTSLQEKFLLCEYFVQNNQINAVRCLLLALELQCLNRLLVSYL